MIFGGTKKTKEQKRAERELKKKNRLIKKTKKKIKTLASKFERRYHQDPTTATAAAKSDVEGSRWYKKRRKT